MTLITHYAYFFLGSKETIQEKASKYGASAGIEEIELIPDEDDQNENQNDLDDDDLSPLASRSSTKEIKKRTTSKGDSRLLVDINSPTVDHHCQNISKSL